MKAYIPLLVLFLVVILGQLLWLKTDIFRTPHFLERKDKTAPREINGIPLVIYQSWGSHFLPRTMHGVVMKNLEQNPEFDYYLYSDEECRAFIQSHYSSEVVKAFDTLRPGAYKSDLWRYCVLYAKGGVYFDIKLESQTPIVDLLQIQQTMLTKDHVSITKNYDCLWNGLMISAPGNEIFKYCIEDIVKSCREKNYQRNNLDITGPCLLGRMVKQHHPTLYSQYSVFALSIDKIIYNSQPIFKYYKNYRTEQKKWQKGEYYGKLYKDHNVYHE